MKKIISLLLALIFVLSMSVSVFAFEWSDITLDYSLTCDGEHSQTVPTGTIITVEYAIDNITNNTGFTVFTTSNEIYYDHHFFELIPDSFDLEIETVTAILQKPEGPNHKIVHEIYMNDQRTQEYQNHQVVGRFKLKVIATSGSSTIKSTETNSYENGTTKYKVADTLSHLTITVGDESTEPEIATITYSFDGTVENIQAAVGEEITVRVKPDAAPAGKVFDCWQTPNGNQYKPGDKYVVKGNETFTAIWKDSVPPETVKYTLTFHTNGGSTITSIEKVKDTLVNLSSYIPTRTGYEFKGWFSNEALTQKVTSVKLDSDKTIYAKWDKITTGGGTTVTKYTLTFETNGGSSIGSVSKVRNTTVNLSKYITAKDGYSFGGWFTDKEFINKVNEIKMTSDITLYAKWIEGEGGDIIDPNYKPDVLTGEHYAYIVGGDGGYIYPNNQLTRAEAATIFFRLLDDEVRNEGMTKENGFADVNENDWFNTAVSTLANLEIIKGRTTETFAPNETITRAELAALVTRLSEASYDGEDLFTDIVGHWAQNEINIAASIDWIKGSDGLFRPNDNITRAEVMTLINRVLNRQPGDIDDLLDGMIEYPDNMDKNTWYYIAIQEATNSHKYEMKSDGVYEKWTSLTENPNWIDIER